MDNRITSLSYAPRTSAANSVAPAATPAAAPAAPPAPADQLILSTPPKADAPSNPAPPAPQPPAPQPAPTPAPAPPQSPTVLVSIYAQDPSVGPPETVSFDRSKIGTDLSGPRVHITDWGHDKPTPDAQGNYLLAPDSDQFSQVNAQVVTYNTLDMWEHYRGGKIDWAFGGPSLEVIPHKQEGKNAYYSRWEASTNFFFFNSPKLNKEVETANAADVVSHETGHAILDSIRPGYFGTGDPETRAFHEAFGDCTALLYCLQDPTNRDRVIQETGGNLRTNNTLSSLAEEFGKGVRPAGDDATWLRNANNDFTYKPANQLPAGKGDETHLGSEAHSFSRLFTGAFYDALDSIYQEGVSKEGLKPADALKYAADQAGPLLIRSMETAPVNQIRFKDAALGMIKADQEKNNGKFSDALKADFIKRGIISADDLKQEAKRVSHLPDVKLDKPLASGAAALAFANSQANKLGIPADAELETVKMYSNGDGEQFVTLQYPREVPVDVKGLEGNTMDVYGGVTMVFDKNGQLTEYHHTPITDESIQNEMDALSEMQQNGVVRDSKQQTQSPWMSQTGRPYQIVARGHKLERVPVSNC